MRAEIGAAIRAAGYPRAVLDLAGYRRGSLNDALAARELVRLGGAS
jgi:hypothetical protein